MIVGRRTSVLEYEIVQVHERNKRTVVQELLEKEIDEQTLTASGSAMVRGTESHHHIYRETRCPIITQFLLVRSGMIRRANKFMVPMLPVPTNDMR